MRLQAGGAVLLFFLAPCCLAAEPITLPSALLRVSEQVEAAAQEGGLIKALAAREGDLVKAGDLIAQIDDDAAALDLERAETELEVARLDAENDVLIRIAQKTLAVAQSELRRNVELKAQFTNAVSQSELDRLKLVAERSELELEQARHKQQAAQLALKLKQNALDVAKLAVQRRRVVAPLDAVVVEIKRRAGEWVEPGQPVVRLIRIDKLRAEAFVGAAAASPSLVGSPVTFAIDLPDARRASFSGQVVFVDPEIDPVNGQTRLWAEIDNRDLRLRPGLKGAMTVGR